VNNEKGGWQYQVKGVVHLEQGMRVEAAERPQEGCPEWWGFQQLVREDHTEMFFDIFEKDVQNTVKS